MGGLGFALGRSERNIVILLRVRVALYRIQSCVQVRQSDALLLGCCRPQELQKTLEKCNVGKPALR